MIKNLVIAKWISVAFILCTLIGCASLDWPIIKATDKIEYYELYLREYPNSEYAPQAQKRIGELYEEAKSVKAITTYEDFLQKYPNSEYAPEVSNRLELLHFENAKSLRTIGNYRDFLQKYPSSKYAGELSQNLQELEKEVYNIEIATKKVLPEEVNIEVTTISQFHDEPEFVITGHLLKGHSADDSDPYVRGDYGTREKLTSAP